MGNIITPKKLLKNGKETWQTKKDKKATQATKMVRTGKETFNIHHDNGDMFECKIDPTKVKLPPLGGKMFLSGSEIRAKNVMSNADRRKLGLELDPDLPD
jgi:hypothetical protein